MQLTIKKKTTFSQVKFNCSEDRMKTTLWKYANSRKSAINSLKASTQGFTELISTQFHTENVQFQSKLWNSESQNPWWHPWAICSKIIKRTKSKRSIQFHSWVWWDMRANLKFSHHTTKFTWLCCHSFPKKNTQQPWNRWSNQLTTNKSHRRFWDFWTHCCPTVRSKAFFWLWTIKIKTSWKVCLTVQDPTLSWFSHWWRPILRLRTSKSYWVTLLRTKMKSWLRSLFLRSSYSAMKSWMRRLI